MEETVETVGEPNSAQLPLRTSARVSKKLKLDQEAAAALAASTGKKDEREFKDEVVTVAPVASEKPRVRRVLWSPDDKNAFFEALNEHGKNFDEIDKFMSSRNKRRMDPSAKGRERAKYFYYRTWHKISKHVHFPETVKKSTQELYALINFGELRKKVGHVTEKNGQKLNELIYSGCTQVRVKGKAWRVKTPVCRALRRLNQFEDDSEEVKLPSRVEVLISPRTNVDAARVQNLAHNPRVRTTLSLDSTMNSVTSFLERRWSARNSEVLKIGPKKEAVPVQASFKVGQVLTSGSVSLLAHEKLRGDPTSYERVKALLSAIQVGKTKSMLKSMQKGEEESSTDDRLNSEVVDPRSIADEEAAADATQGQVDARETPSDRTRIGQLYLMYGSKGVLELDYWWETASSSQPETSEFTKALTRLISLAKLFQMKIKVECPCGHICRNVKSSVPNPSVPKGKLTSSKVAMKPTKFETTPGGFKQPLPAPGRPIAPSVETKSTSQSEALAALQALQRSKYCHRRGRQRQRSLVVQRMLPLLPAPPVMVTLQALQVVPGPAPLVSFPKIEAKSSPDPVLDGLVTAMEPSEPTEPVLDSLPTEPKEESLDLPTSSTSVNSFRGILGGDGTGGELMEETPPTSPTRILKEGEGQWLNSEVSDFSLSSFLGHLESPLKTNGAPTADESHLSSDVESHFQSLMTESSLDYTAKFADLAAKIVGSTSSPSTPPVDPSPVLTADLTLPDKYK